MSLNRVSLSYYASALFAIGIFFSFYAYAQAQAVYSTPYTISTLAGAAYNTGTEDGSGLNAQFNNPFGITVDTAGNLYVADSKNYAIRKITPSGIVTTIAGQAGVAGNTDGIGTAAQFGVIEGIAVDASGNLYVTDITYNTVRKLTQSSGNWNVSTLVTRTAGLNQPIGITVDSAGNLYVADSSNFVIRKITPTGYMSTLAGSIGQSSGINGTGTGATFSGPVGVAVDSSGNLYVTDSAASTIRKVTAAGVVTTIGGFIGAPGLIDGPLNTTGNQFSHPFAIAVDSKANLYITDQSSLTTVRQISATGIVSTLAGAVNIAAASNGVGNLAYFNNPHGIAVDSAGNLYIADSGNSIIRKGVFSTVNLSAPIITSDTKASGNVGTAFSYKITASNSTSSYAVSGTLPAGLTLNTTTGIISGTPTAAGISNLTVSAVNSGGVGTSNLAITVTSIVLAPTIISQPINQLVQPGTSVTISITASGSSMTYQWYFNNLAITGATLSSYTIPSILPTNAGTYTVNVSNSAGSITSQSAQIKVLNPSRLTNLSVLSLDGPGSQLLTVGFVSGGTGTTGGQNLLIRGSGPSIGVAPFSVPNALPDPTLTVYNSSTAVVASNDNWGTPVSNATSVIAANAATGAFVLTNTASLDAALVANLTPGGYSVQVAGKNGAVGNVIAEIYDITPSSTYTITTPRLINLSCLEQVAAGGILSAGFVIGGTTSEQVLIRASGPTLADAPFNLHGTIPDPRLTLFNSSSEVLATNTGWNGNASITAANTATGAFQFINTTSKDSAIILTLQPGAYTVQVTSVTGIAGVALIEVYEVPSVVN
jgi:sugar lactone lactonase YvrE